jgi:hypothetical protein
LQICLARWHRLQITKAGRTRRVTKLAGFISASKLGQHLLERWFRGTGTSILVFPARIHTVVNSKYNPNAAFGGRFYHGFGMAGTHRTSYNALGSALANDTYLT